MASTNPVVSRIKNQHSRIHGMLSPGLKQQPKDSSSASLTPVLKDFAGSKFRVAARKMRVLDITRMGNSDPTRLASLSTDIQKKFQGLDKILHVQRSSGNETSNWSDVETTLTGGTGSQAEPEKGVMRRGSIIQPMSTTLKPGQSLDSFKQQVQARSSHTKPEQPAKKPNLPPNARRYSRVQEVDTNKEPPQIPAEPVDSVESKEQPQTPTESPVSPTVQPQKDPMAAPPKPESKFNPDTASSAATVEKPPIAKASKAAVQQADQSDSMPLRLPFAYNEYGIVSERPDSTQTPPTDGGMELPSAPLKEIKLARRDELPQAEPVTRKESSRSDPLSHPVLKKAMPAKNEKPETRKLLARAVNQPKSKPASYPTALPTIHRQVDDASYSPNLAAIPKKSNEIQEDVNDLGTKRSTLESEAESPSIPIEKKAASLAESESSDLSEKVEMPLKEHIDYRKQTARSLRKVQPQKVNPVSKPSLLNPEKISLARQYKFPARQVSDALPGSKIPHPVFPQPASNQPSPASVTNQAMAFELPRRQESEAIPSKKPSISMPLSAQPAAPTSRPKVQKPSVSVSTSQTSDLSAPPAKQAAKSPSNVVQRMWEEHTPMGAHDVPSKASTKTPDTTNPQNLAEKVLPYVKRILENEAYRSSRI